MKTFFRRFIRQSHGQDLIEFGLLAGILTAATVVAIENIGIKVTGAYGNAVTQVIASGGGGAPGTPDGGGGGGNGNGNNGNGNGTGNNGNGTGNNGNGTGNNGNGKGNK